MNNIILEFESLFPRDIPVVFFHAHADDESFLSAGLINHLVKSGINCTIVYAATSLVEGQIKTNIRQAEAFQACKTLGIDQIQYLKFCEPQYKELSALPFIHQKAEYIADELNNILVSQDLHTAFILISYDKNGGYGNDDHKLVHTAGREYLKKYNNNIFSLFEVTLNRNKILSWLDDAKKRLNIKSLPLLSYWSDEFGLLEKEITHKYLLTNEELHIKHEALSAHKSQIALGEFPLSLTQKDFSKVFQEEYYLLVNNINL